MTTRDVTNLSDISKIPTNAQGAFTRPASSFRNFVQAGGRFPPEKDRYHLYVSYACPWASRTLILRKLKGLEDVIPFTVVSPQMGTEGWPFASADPFPGADVDPLYQSQHVKDLYLRADPNYSGRFTVPVLWDKKQHTIVNNESSEILRILNSEFNAIVPEDKAKVDFYPAELRKEIDEVNEWVYDRINSASAYISGYIFRVELNLTNLTTRADGVYKSGFAKTPEAYRDAVQQLFEALDRVEVLLKDKTYLIGDRLTEADIRLFVTIVSSGSPRTSGYRITDLFLNSTQIRFDPVYVGHFKCNIRTIRDGYSNIHRQVLFYLCHYSHFSCSLVIIIFQLAA